MRSAMKNQEQAISQDLLPLAYIGARPIFLIENRDTSPPIFLNHCPGLTHPGQYL